MTDDGRGAEGGGFGGGIGVSTSRATAARSISAKANRSTRALGRRWRRRGGGRLGAVARRAGARRPRTPARQLRREGEDRQAGRMGGDVRRRVADDEIPLLRSEDARQGLGRDAGKYQPLVAHVGDRQELLNIVNEMIGELNASHTGAAPGRPGGDGRHRRRCTWASSSSRTRRRGATR